MQGVAHQVDSIAAMLERNMLHNNRSRRPCIMESCEQLGTRLGKPPSCTIAHMGDMSSPEQPWHCPRRLDDVPTPHKKRGEHASPDTTPEAPSETPDRRSSLAFNVSAFRVV